MRYTKEQMLAAYDVLPSSIKEALDSVDEVGIIQSVGVKHRLHIDQLGKLSDEISFVVLGLERAENFTQNLERQVGLVSLQADEIAVEVNREIFSKIRGQLRELTTKPTAALTREEVLKEIENPPAAFGEAPSAPPAPSLVEQKMSGLFHLPRVENAEKPPADPYRESID